MIKRFFEVLGKKTPFEHLIIEDIGENKEEENE